MLNCRLLRLALLLCLCASALPVPNASAAQPSGRKPAPGVYLLDDWTGRAGGIAWAKGSMVNVAWQEIEPESGRFTFERIDAWLERLQRSGKKGAFGILLRCEDNAAGEDACTPRWALDWDPVMASGKPRLNFLDDRVQSHAVEMIDAVARHYAGDGRLSHVQINLGYAGTVSPCPGVGNIAGQAEECSAYASRNSHAEQGSGWNAYEKRMISAYADSFMAAGGPNHVPLQVVLTGKFLPPADRQTVVEQALRYNIGLHDGELAASFLTGDYQTSGCLANGQSDKGTGLSHWQVLEQYGGNLPLSAAINPWPHKSEITLSDEENVWWSVLNALDKRVSVMYVDLGDLRWGEAWQYFARYAGRNAQNSTDAWIALRDMPSTWCGDAGDYEWLIQRRVEAAGSSSLAWSASQAGGRTGSTWQGAYSRSTDISSGKPALYFDVADGLVRDDGTQIVSVEVTYWDGDSDDAGATWELSYDATDAPSQSAGTVTLRGSGRWLMRPFVLVDAAFHNRIPDAKGKASGDLRLAATGSNDVRFHMLRVRVLTGAADAGGQGSARRSPSATPASSITAGETTPKPTKVETPGTGFQAKTLPDEPSPTPSPTAEGVDILRYQATGSAVQVEDTYLDAAQPSQNLATSNNLVLRGDGSERALLRFNLEDVPPDAQVNAAWLEVIVAGRTRPSAMEVQVRPVPQVWEVNSASWQQAAPGQAWSVPGAGSANNDDPTAATFVLPAVGPAQVNLTDLVQAWIKHPEANRGVVLQGSGAPDLEYYLISSEWRFPSARPRLRIRLAEAAAPQATVSANQTPAITRTETVTASRTLTATSGLLLRRTPQPSIPSEPVTTTVRIVSVEPEETDSHLSSITTYLYGMNGESPACNWQPTVRLWGAAGQQPAVPLGVGSRRMITEDERTFPAWDFTGIDLTAAQGSEAILHLFATVDEVTASHNIVTLGAEEGTNYPQPVTPVKVADGLGGDWDASIEILWPHEGTAISGAAKANLSLALFRHGTRDVLPAAETLPPSLRLHWSINDGPDQAGAQPPEAQPRLIQTPWLTYYLWDFPNVDVSPAQQPSTYVNYWVEIPGKQIHTNVWSHGSGPRPAPQAPLPITSCR